MKRGSEILRNLTMLTQFGLSLITPLLMCLGICWYLTTHTGLGPWIYFVGFFFGLGGSGTFAYKTFKKAAGQAEKKDKNDAAFNRHD